MEKGEDLRSQRLSHVGVGRKPGKNRARLLPALD